MGIGTHWLLRKRHETHRCEPLPQEMNGSLYAYHEGDLFTPGTQNYVFEPKFTLPVSGWWGRGFARFPNTFNPLQPPQVYSNPTVRVSGIGGLQAGTMALQPLETDEG